MWGFDQTRSRTPIATDCSRVFLAHNLFDAPAKWPYLSRMLKIFKPIKALWQRLPFSADPKPLVTVIDLRGVIGDTGGPGRKGLTLARVEGAIEAAFKPDNLTAVALSINSPGGSPVQSRLIHNAIRREAVKKNVPVLAFVEDVGASGGYILSIAGDEIYADESSIVGSIGVIAATFGFHESIKRLGIERRVHTAGESKSQLDAFQPEDPDDVDRLKKILDALHRQFIDLVKERRGTALSGEPETFSGAFWTADDAKSLGLIDGIAQLGDFLPTRFGEDVIVKKIASEKSSLLKRLLNSDAQIAVANAEGNLIDADNIIATAQARALWARYGM